MLRGLQSKVTAGLMRRGMLNPALMPLVLLSKAPLALAAGVKMRRLDHDRCVVTVPYQWRTQNPFQSIYFAALSMAAELSTAGLVILHAHRNPASIAYIITGIQANFTKRANDLTTFTSQGVESIEAAIKRTAQTGEAVTANVTTVGRLPNGEEVSRFTFTWSLKKRR